MARTERLPAVNAFDVSVKSEVVAGLAANHELDGLLKRVLLAVQSVEPTAAAGVNPPILLPSRLSLIDVSTEHPEVGCSVIEKFFVSSVLVKFTGVNVTIFPFNIPPPVLLT